MKVALVNPNWRFEGSIYFGCREPHLPLEYGYASELLAAEGHVPLLVDAQMEQLSLHEIVRCVEDFAPDFTVITTAPSYLFWRCAPPELRVPKQLLNALNRTSGLRVVIGPHISTTPRAALLKLDADAGIMGEPEEILPRLVSTPRDEWSRISSICYRRNNEVVVQGAPHQSDMSRLPVLRWPRETIQKHSHHHHRFESRSEERRVGKECRSRWSPYH